MSNPDPLRPSQNRVRRDKRDPVAPGITKVTSWRTGAVSYVVRWSVTGPDGNRVPGHDTVKTIKAARALKARMEAAKAEGRYEAPSRETVDAYAQRWFPRKERSWATSTTYQRHRKYERHIGPRFGRLKLTDVTRSMCQAYADELAEEYAPETVSNTLAVLTGIMGAAMREGLIPRDPAERLEKPSIPRGEHVVWSDAQLARFLDATADHVDKALYVLILSTGCRIGEALALTWNMIDLEAGTAEIASTLRMTITGGKAPAPGTKTPASERTVPLTPACVAALRAHRERQGADRRRASRWDVRGYVFTHPSDGRDLSYGIACKRLRRVQEEMPQPWTRLTFHDMRHLVASRLGRQRVHPAIVRDLLGHTTTRMSMDRYTHTDLEDIAAAVEGLDRTTTSPAKQAEFGIVRGTK